jgi:hypothetical protein
MRLSYESAIGGLASPNPPYSLQLVVMSCTLMDVEIQNPETEAVRFLDFGKNYNYLSTFLDFVR